MKDEEFKKELGIKMSRSILKRWKKLYFKKERTETISEFYKRILTFFKK